MSGGGSTPKAPDLSGNVANANATFGTATADAAQTMNTATAYNQQAQDNLKNVTAQTNSLAGSIGSTAQQNLSTYGSAFVPLQQQEAEQAAAYGSDANIRKLQGQAVANTNAANQAARKNSAAALAAEGIDPGSVHGAALDRQQSVQNAAQVAGASTNSAINTAQTAFGMENTANTLGLNIANQGTAGAATGAQVAQAGQSGINSTNSSDINNLTASNSYLGTATNANKSAADIASQGFQNQMSANAAQQSSSAGIGSLIGDVAGAAMMFMEEGGSVPAGPAMRLGIPVATNYSGGGNVTSRGALPMSPIPGSTDTKPALLTPGEFVMPKDVVDFKGQDYFHRQVDSIREAKNKRSAIPTLHRPHVSMH